MDSHKSIFLDFDSTITTRDTIHSLANFALREQQRRQERGRDHGQSRGGTDNDDNDDDAKPDLAAKWDQVVRAYIDGYQAAVDAYLPAAADRSTANQEGAFLRSLKDSELTSLNRVHQCGLFRGISAKRFRDAGRRAAGMVAQQGSDSSDSSSSSQFEEVDGVEFRHRQGFADFVEAALRHGWCIWVISVNWSSAFIEGALGPHDEHIKVVANDIREEDGAVQGPPILNPVGDEGRLLTNSGDKLDVMRAILGAEGGRRQGGPTIYAGDSTTDLECLLAADRGIVMADEQGTTLLRTLERIGIPVSYTGGSTPPPPLGLCWATDYSSLATDAYLDRCNRSLP